MSGPTTVLLTVDPVTALLSAAAIRAAEAVYQGYARAAELHAQHTAARDAARAQQEGAQQRGREALEREAQAAEARFDQFIALFEKLGAGERVRATRPVRPRAEEATALAAYIRALQMLCGELQTVLLTETARQKHDFAEFPGEIAMPAAALPQQASQRLLARIAHLGPPPEDIATLARELDATLPGERSELLTLELSHRIQGYAEALQRRLVQEATATILEQSLEDLGYQVEEVADTLFVEGGVVHFRRPGWGDYIVRLRVDAKAGSANFNVLRAIDSERDEASVLDHIAEDRWCAEFPALLKTLAARGVKLDITRRLAAGEVPVQRVERGTLPAFADDDEAAGSAAKPLARQIK